MREADTMRAIQLEASRLGARLWRNNIANGWIGDATQLADGSVLLRNPRRVSFGIPGPGGSDLLGLVPRDGVAVFASVEVKTEHGRVTPEQQAWLEAVRKAGGIAGVCRSVEDLRRLVGGDTNAPNI